MVNIISEVSKYLILIFMGLYTIKCFSYFTASGKEERDINLNKQIVYIFLIHFFCNMILFLKKMDPKILLLYAAEIIIAITFILVYHKAYKNASRLITNNISFLLLIGYTIITRLDYDLAVKQFVLATAGLFVTAFIPLIMDKLPKMKNWSVFYGIAGIVFLLTVFIPGIGLSKYGSRNWISIGPISLQPMEFVKILFILFVAAGLLKAETFKEIMINAIIAVCFMGILLIEKDLGAMAIFYVCYVMMVYLATSRVIFLIGGAGLAVGGGALMFLLFKNVSFFSHVLVRINAWLDPFKYHDTDGYQVCESLFAIGTGGFAGSGLGQGMPYLIPVSESDFIFAAICEELGLIFGILLILVYLSSFIAMMNIAMKCKKTFYKYVCFGVAIVYIFQILLNIGGVTKFIPSTGVTLPLVSYGVSSVLSTLILFAMVQYTYILVSKEADRFEKEKERLTIAGYTDGQS